jgi:hypothetical protein
MPGRIGFAPTVPTAPGAIDFFGGAGGGGTPDGEVDLLGGGGTNFVGGVGVGDLLVPREGGDGITTPGRVGFAVDIGLFLLGRFIWGGCEGTGVGVRVPVK